MNRTCYHIVVLVLTITFGSIFSSKAQYQSDKQHVELTMRMIGHQLLLHSKDSTSRVLPIQRDGERYKIQLASDFEFHPNELVATIDSVVTKTKIAQSYLVEIANCSTHEIVYSYKVGKYENTDVIPCAKRTQPKACYYLLFTILDLSSPTTTIETDNDEASSNVHYTWLVLVVLILGGLIYFWQRKKKQPKTPEGITIGKYIFDQHNMTLLFQEQSHELSSKEADLLFLLYSSVNETLEREFILKSVWGNNGDYVGRTLDVFISKLRKKLEADPNVKIVNIRGVGYKLVLSQE